jgi:hypothetical protein
MGAFLLVLVLGVGGLGLWLHRTGALPGIVDRAREMLAQIYPSRPLSPRTLPKRMLRAAEQTVTVGVTRQVILPTRIVISVHPDELEPIEELVDWLCGDIAEALRAKAKENGWVVPSGPEVSIVADPDRPLRVPRAVGHLGRLSPEPMETMVAPASMIDAGEAESAEGSTIIHTEVVKAGVHLRLVSTSDNTGDADLSAVLYAGQLPIVLGRSSEVELRVRDRKVSGRHCAFSLDAQGDLQVEDLSSTNGTTVDDRKVTGSSPLKSGETLGAGASTWRVELGSA